MDKQLPSERLLKWFTFDHLREDLKPISKSFANLAYEVAGSVPESAEKTTALRKLLEAKDCAVRAVLEHNE